MRMHESMNLVDSWQKLDLALPLKRKCHVYF